MLEINVNELRVGSVVGLANFMDFKAVKVTEIRKERVLVEGSVGIYSSKNHKIIPIELSEKWLLRLGFKQSKGKWGNDFHILEKDGFICMFTIEHWTDTQEDSKFKNHWHCKYQLNGNKLKYIHEVQNLFFSLCGEELVFSSTEP